MREELDLSVLVGAGVNAELAQLDFDEGATKTLAIASSLESHLATGIQKAIASGDNA